VRVPVLLLLAAAAAAAAADGLITGLLCELGVVRMSTMLRVGEHQRAFSRSNLLGGVVSWGTPMASLQRHTSRRKYEHLAEKSMEPHCLLQLQQCRD
jgi:hypothetical protein